MSRASSFRSSLVAAALLVPVAASAGAAQEIVGRKETTFTLNEKIGSGDWVRVFSSAGDIVVTEGSGGGVDFKAEKDARRGSIEDIGFIVRRGSEGVTICAVYVDDDNECDEDGMHSSSRGRRWRNWGSRAKVRLEVRIPRGARVRLGSGNGDISLDAAAAEANLGSGNGKVVVRGVTGRVSASSGNGEVTVDDVGGPVKVSSGNGDITVSATSGPVTASSGNGDLRISMQRLSGRDDLEFSTGNGRVVLDLPSDFSADVEASTGNGKVVTDFPITIQGRVSPTRLRGTIGNGGRRLTLSSGNGTIEIRKASAR